MNISKNMLRLYAVSDRSWLKDNKDLRDILPLLFENGVTLFQLREKHLVREAFIKEALELKEICRRYHIPLIINDAVDIAKEIGADGVHVGLSDMDIKKPAKSLGLVQLSAQARIIPPRHSPHKQPERTILAAVQYLKPAPKPMPRHFPTVSSLPYAKQSGFRQLQSAVSQRKTCLC